MKMERKRSVLALLLPRRAKRERFVYIALGSLIRRTAFFPRKLRSRERWEDQYLNFTALFRARRRASKSGCDLTICISVSITAIMTPGSISCSVHARNGSRGVGRLSKWGFSRVNDTSLDLGERSGSSILRNNRPQLWIFKIS